MSLNNGANISKLGMNHGGGSVRKALIYNTEDMKEMIDMKWRKMHNQSNFEKINTFIDCTC